jgi:hypothetical protein
MEIVMTGAIHHLDGDTGMLRTAVLADSYPKYYPMRLCRLDRQWEVAI